MTFSVDRWTPSWTGVDNSLGWRKKSLDSGISRKTGHYLIDPLEAAPALVSDTGRTTYPQPYATLLWVVENAWNSIDHFLYDPLHALPALAYRSGPTSFPQARTQQMWANQPGETSSGVTHSQSGIGYLLSNFPWTVAPTVADNLPRAYPQPLPVKQWRHDRQSSAAWPVWSGRRQFDQQGQYPRSPSGTRLCAGSEQNTHNLMHSLQSIQA